MNTNVKIKLHGKEYNVKLNGKGLSQEFEKMDPFDTSLSEYASNHYWGPIPKKLSTPENLKTSHPKKNGVYYADHLTSIAVFFDESLDISPYVIYHIGDVIENLSELKNAPSIIHAAVNVD